jgi:hypothetical protein
MNMGVKLVQARLVKLLLEPSSRPSPKIVFKLDLYINRAQLKPTHEALNNIKQLKSILIFLLFILHQSNLY